MYNMIYISAISSISNTFNAVIGNTVQNMPFLVSKFMIFIAYFTNYWTNTRHVCTHLIAFSMVIPIIVMKFNNCDIFWYFFDILNLSSAHVCRVVIEISWLDHAAMLYLIIWLYYWWEHIKNRWNILMIIIHVCSNIHVVLTFYWHYWHTSSIYPSV